ncbi:MAG: hypothetical protein ACOY3V_06545 [Pseudomonadota bacterium]
MKKILLLLLFGTFTQVASCAELEVIQLRHRSAEAMLPSIRPLLDDDETVTGMDYQIVLRASAQHLESVRQVLRHLDTAPHNLRITVLQNVDSETVSRLTEISADVGLSDDARLRIPASTEDGGLNVRLANGQDYLNARIVSQRELANDHKIQQLRVLEGNRALIRSGQNLAIPQTQVIHRRWGSEVVESVQYQQVESGFFVLPRLNGDWVDLEISAQNDNVADVTNGYPATEQQRAASTIRGRLGTWLAVGDIREQQTQSGATLSDHDGVSQETQRRILLKVELID